MKAKQILLVLVVIIASVGIIAEPKQKDPNRKMPRVKSDTMELPKGQRALMGAWKVGSTINVYFMNGYAQHKQQFADCVSEWGKYGNFQIKFHSGPMPNGVYSVLVKFEEIGGRSFVGAGTSNNTIPSVYVPFDSDSCTVYIHEFGHTLGLVHEFENPASIPHLNPSIDVYEELEAAFGWDRKTADTKLLKRKVTAGQEKPFDPESVMGYTSNLFPDLYKEEINMEPGETLSKGDQAYIAKLYPGKKTQEILPYSFVEENPVKVESTVNTKWTQQNLTLSVPSSFKVQAMDSQRFSMANPDMTSQVYFTVGITDDYDKLDAKGMAIRTTLLNNLPLKNVQNIGSNSASNGRYNLFGLRYSADGVDKSGKPIKYIIRLVEYKFKSGLKLTGHFMFREDYYMLQQFETLVTSAEIGGGTTTNTTETNTTDESTDVSPNSSVADANTCGQWMEQYNLKPHRSWGKMPGHLQKSWDDADCNHKVCQYMKDKYGMKSSGDLGKLPVSLQSVWTTPEIDCPNHAK